MPSLNVWRPGADIPCWIDGVPAAQLAESRGIVSDSGELFVFTIDVTSLGRDSVNAGAVRLPIPLSKISAVSVRSRQYRDQLIARISEFPDVVLDGVEFRVEPHLFSSVSAAQANYEILSTPREAAVDRRPEKCAGAVAGILAAIDAGLLSRERAEDVWNALGASVGGQDADIMLGLALGSSLSVESVDELSSEVLVAVLRRLGSISAQTGFEPIQFLDAIYADVHSTGRLADLAGLDRFIAAAKPLVSLHPGGNRELLQDGGAIVLRGVTAFLRSPSVEKLAATAVRGGRVGSHVATFAMFLAGYLEGIFALPRDIKASTKERLWGLGQLAEAIGYGARVESGASTLYENGTAFRALSLFGRVVRRSEVGMPKWYERFAVAANEAGLQIGASDNGPAILVERNGNSITLAAQMVAPAFLFPSQDLVRLTLSIASPKTASARMQISEAIGRAGLVYDLSADSAGISVSLFLSDAITSASLQAGVERLLEFWSTQSTANRAPANKRVKRNTQTKVESERKE